MNKILLLFGLLFVVISCSNGSNGSNGSDDSDDYCYSPPMTPTTLDDHDYPCAPCGYYFDCIGIWIENYYPGTTITDVEVDGIVVSGLQIGGGTGMSPGLGIINLEKRGLDEEGCYIVTFRYTKDEEEFSVSSLTNRCLEKGALSIVRLESDGKIRKSPVN